MFSLTRPSPAQKCASSISSSYVPAGWLAKSADAVSSSSGLGAVGGVDGLWSRSAGLGSALCAMSVRKGVSKWSASAGTGTGLARSPSTSPLLVTYCGRPFGPGMNLPYGSAAIIGMFVTSASTSLRPSSLAAWYLTVAHVAMPLCSSPAGPPSSLPVETGTPSPFISYSRRKTWCEEWDVYVWLWSTHGESVLLAFWTSSMLSSSIVLGSSPRILSGPGWFCARVSTMKRWLGGRSSLLPRTWSGPAISGSSSCSGTNTVPPLLTVWSTPWSKNWPKKVKSELYGGERPTSVVTFGMKSVLCDGTQFLGSASTGGSASGSGSTLHGNRPGLSWVRTG